MQKRGKRIALAAGVPVALFLAGEGVARPTLSAEAREKEIPEAFRKGINDAILDLDDRIGWRLRPSSAQERIHPLYRTTYRVNAAGCRASRECAPRPPQGKTRIACLGDSFTFGQGVDEADRYTDRLEALLPDTEVLNFGVFGYGTDQMLLRLEGEALAYRPKVVLLAHLTSHIRRNVAREKLSPDPVRGEVRVVPKPRFHLEGSELRGVGERLSAAFWRAPDPAPEVPRTLLGSRLLGALSERISRLRESLDPLPEYGEEEGEAWRLTAAIFLRAAEACRQAGATPVLVVLPDSGYVSGRLRSLARLTPFERLRALGERAAMPVVDLLPAMREAVDRLGFDAVYFPGDNHWTAEGHRVAAREIATGLRRLGLVGESGSR